MAKKIKEMNVNELRRLPMQALAKGLRDIQIQNAGLEARVDQRERSVAAQASQKGLNPLMAGNIGDLTKIIWPFWFQSESVQVESQAIQTANVTISQEAAFVITHISLAVFEVTVVDAVAEQPSVETLTFVSNALTDHILSFNGNDITIGTDFALGGDLNATLDNLATYMNNNNPYDDAYVVVHPAGENYVTVTTIQTGLEANENNEFTYTPADGDAPLVASIGFIGGAEAIAAATTLNYVNLKENSNEGLLDNLKVQIVDSQSSRSWHDEPIPATVYGDAKDPFMLDKPYMVLQNQNLEVRWTNSGDKIYIPTLLFHGYRMRVSDAEGIMSLVTE